MSLLTSYTDANKVTDSLLSVRYTAEYSSSDKYYTLTRTAVKSYAYIGMTQSAAEECAKAKIAQYTRSVCRLDTNHESSSGVPGVCMQTECVATCSLSKGRNESWACSIEVDETDVIAKKTVEDSVAGLFAGYAYGRNYDEDTSAIFVTDVSKTDDDTMSISVSYSGVITDERIAYALVEYKSSYSETSWTTVMPTSVSGGGGGAIIVAEITPADGYVFRIKCCNVTSNAAVYSES